MADAPPRVLVVDDEPHILKTMELALRALGHTVEPFARPHDAVAAVAEGGPGRFDLAFVDLMMRPLDGLQVLDALRARAPETPVVIITAHGSIETAVEAVKRGAFHYLQKPFELDEVRLLAERALEHGRLRGEVAALRAQLTDEGRGYGPVLTRNAAFRDLLDLATSVAASTLPVLIEGESGTGKELVAALLHEQSPRASGPFVRVNCAAIPESLFESELFGHVRGAFTGAVKDRQGRFEAAHGGTLFLDEVGEVPASVQVKLLRVLQHKEVERVGESTPRSVDVRVVAATNKNLDAALREGTFREDLFYRLNGVRLRLPPLRERPDDVPLLVAHFAERAAGGAAPSFSPEAMRALQAYRWPGNVRELENTIERAVLLARGGAVEVRHLPEEMRGAPEAGEPLLSLEEVERRHIVRVLAAAKDYEEAARVLGIDPATLWRKRKRYGLG
ncbi:MAG TPA: sigma-54 dependent transcriptional regulator [Rubricoccaceae bacterium]|nr:sigma-54 dependent transcriptional regulator [Rubricoccaceae bacterium]